MDDHTMAVSALVPGARIVGPGGPLIVVQVGQREHSGGYGPVDLTVAQLQGDLEPGSIVTTPWGQAEIVAEHGRHDDTALNDGAAPCGQAKAVTDDVQARLAEIERHLAATERAARQEAERIAKRLVALVPSR